MQNEYIFKKDLYFVQMRYIFFTFSFIFFSLKKKKFFLVKKFFNIKLFFHIKIFFSTSNVDFVKNKYFFKMKKKIFFLLRFPTDE